MESELIKYVVVLAVDLAHLDKILLVHKNRPAHLNGRLNLLGGKIEPGESITAAAIRELKEESGLDPQPVGNCPIEYAGFIEGTSCIIHCVIVPVDFNQRLQPRSGETEVVEWFDWCKVRFDVRLMPNLRVTVPLMQTRAANKVVGRTGWRIDDKTPFDPNSTHHTVRLTLASGSSLDLRLGRPTEKIEFIEVVGGVDGEVQG